ncbi:Rrf2 family transcriptional regulator [Proteobacteria bacterium 005FR1]|nr:Rrf2 family transcriptional regulator [Proteobacteria bacterium 005FR1]
MQLSAFSDYGLRTLMYLAAVPDRHCNVREIAEHYGISRNHLVKVVHRLSQLGYIASTRGKGGGIRLALPADELRLGDLIAALEPMQLVECFETETDTCKITSVCRLKHYLFDANRAFLQSLNQHTLAETIEDRDPFLQVLNISD